MYCIVIKADGTVTREDLNFKQCQDAVGGYVESLKLSAGVWAYVNEEGISLNLPPNPKATALCRALGPNISMADHIKGTMVVTGPGGNRSLAPQAINRVTDILKAVVAATAQAGTGDVHTDKFDVVHALQNHLGDRPDLLAKFNWLIKVWNTDDDRSYEEFDPTKPYGANYKPDDDQ